jgi:HEPN domain-containing protein
MNTNKRKMTEGWIDKASNQLQAAKQHLKSFTQYSEVIEAAQECVELSVKSILSLLNIKYTRSHDWLPNKKEFDNIAEQIQNRRLLDKLAKLNLDHTIRLPRLLFLMNFWAQFYITAKYGFEAEYLSSARDLFNKEEAELAVKHAGECLRAASELRYLNKDKIAALVKSEVS